MTAPIFRGRYAAAYDGPVVLFIIGMRINRLWRIDRWLPVARAIGPMLAELAEDPQSGYLGAEQLFGGLRTFMTLQYWRDFDSLERYSRARDRKHFPAWTAFQRSYGKDGAQGAVGIFHETYCVADGGRETIYGDMPAFGLGAVSGVVPASGPRSKARTRMSAQGKVG